jgi:hypothetical protein
MKRTGTECGPRFSEMCQQSCDIIKLIRRYPHNAVELLKCFDIKSKGFHWIISRLLYEQAEGTDDKRAFKYKCMRGSYD